MQAFEYLFDITLFSNLLKGSKIVKVRRGGSSFSLSCICPLKKNSFIIVDLPCIGSEQMKNLF